MQKKVEQGWKFSLLFFNFGLKFEEVEVIGLFIILFMVFGMILINMIFNGSSDKKIMREKLLVHRMVLNFGGQFSVVVSRFQEIVGLKLGHDVDQIFKKLINTSSRFLLFDVFFYRGGFGRHGRW